MPRPKDFPRLDQAAILKEVAKGLEAPARRLFLQRAMTLGGLSLLTGCSITDEESVEKLLLKVSRFNDRVQAWLFDPERLAPTYPESMIARPFPFNAYYDIDEVPVVDGASYVLQVGGRVADRRSWTLAELAQLPQATQVTRHICVEGWSAIGKWSGVPFHLFLQRIGADLDARYVAFFCADGYYTSIDMPTALHPQTQLTLGFDDGVLPPPYGYPMKLRMPTKLGFKNPKHITELYVTNTYPGGYWEDQGYNWFSGS